MKKKVLFSLMAAMLIITAAIFTACTDNQRARSWGGEMTINLQPNQKIVNATWKDEDLWILTRPMRADETPEVYTFQENSTWGIMEGTVTIVEKR